MNPRSLRENIKGAAMATTCLSFLYRLFHTELLLPLRSAMALLTERVNPQRRMPRLSCVVATLLVVFWTCLPSFAGEEPRITPFQLGIFGPVKIPWNINDVRGVAIGLLYNNLNSMAGLEVGLIANMGSQIEKYDSPSFQTVSIPNAVSVTTYKRQEGFGGTKGSVDGVQFSVGVNFTENDVRGIQVAALNMANNLKGAQVGWINMINHDVYGMQLSIINVCNDNMAGAQIGVFNLMSRKYRIDDEQINYTHSGIQLGGLNWVCGKMTGLQIGILNRAGTLCGMQIGAFNIINKGAPLSFMPIINGSF